MKSSLQILLGISLLILAVAIALHLLVVRPATELGEVAIHGGEQTVIHGIDRGAEVMTNGLGKVGEILAAVFQSKVTISSSSSTFDATPVAELAVLKRNLREIIDYSETENYSTKRIVAEQTFVAKIGFDLAARFSASFDPSNRVVVISLPNPKVLSLEPENAAPKYYVDDSGLINKLTTEDHQQILIGLKNQAAHSAEAALAVGDARQMIETRFRDLFSAFNVKVVVEFPQEPKKLTISEPAK